MLERIRSSGFDDHFTVVWLRKAKSLEYHDLPHNFIAFAVLSSVDFRMQHAIFHIPAEILVPWFCVNLKSLWNSSSFEFDKLF